MPYHLNRASRAVTCGLMICLVANAQSSGSEKDPVPTGDGAANSHSIFSRLLKNELIENRTGSAQAISTVANQSVTITIPGHDESATDVRPTSGVSETGSMFIELPKLDPRLSRARRSARSTRITLPMKTKTAGPILQPPVQNSVVQQPIFAPIRIPSMERTSEVAQVVQAGYLDDNDLNDLEQPLSIKVLDTPPIPKPFYQALAQDNQSQDLRNAIEEALQRTEEQPVEKPIKPAESTRPAVEPTIPEPAIPEPTEDTSPLFDESLPPSRSDLDGPDRNTLDRFNSGTEPEPKIEDTIQDLLRHKEPDRAIPKSNPRTKPRARLRLDFPSLLDDDGLSDDDGGSALDDMLNEDGEGEEADEEEALLEQPQVSRPRARRTNYPATLSQVLSADDEQVDPRIEQQYCDQVWRCAGGRCQSWQDRMKRNFCRDYALKTKGCSNQQSWLGDMICNSCGRYGGGLFGFGGGSGMGGGSCGGGAVCGGVDGIMGPVFGNGSCGGSPCTATSFRDSCTDSCTGTGCGRCNSPYFSEWKLWPKLVGRNNSQFTVGGWTSAGYHNNANGLFNDHPDRLNVHQQWFYAQREARPTCNSWDWGFRVDAMYGVDAANTQSFGNNPGVYDFGTGLDHGIYGWAIPQAYVELAGPNMSVIVGHFYSLIGYESVAAPQNFFYSHSLAFNNSEPFTHTGALATYHGLTNSEIYFGWTLGWDTGFDQLDGGSSFLGGFSSPLTQNLNFTYMCTAGDLGWRGDGYSHSLLFDVALSDRWNYVVQSDLLRTARGEDNVGVNQYLFWNINNCLSFGGRMEWWKGDNVTNYAPFNSVLPADGSFSYYQATVGVNIRPGTTNLVFRPEMRFDWSPAVGYEQETFGIDMVLTY